MEAQIEMLGRGRKTGNVFQAERAQAGVSGSHFLPVSVTSAEDTSSRIVSSNGRTRMARKLVMTVARFGWAMAGDVCAVLYILGMLALASAPLALWRLVTRHLYHDIVLQLPLGLVLFSLALASAMSGFILCRLYHSLRVVPLPAPVLCRKRPGR